MYSEKTELSDLPIGLALGCMGHYPGFMNDLKILQLNRDFIIHIKEKDKMEMIYRTYQNTLNHSREDGNHCQ